MLVSTDELPGLAGRVTVASGGFDPLHPGHVRYFEMAAALGLPVLVSVAPDGFVERKHPPLLTQAERAAVIDALRAVSYVHAEELTTAEVLRAVRPRYWVKGLDWEGRLPPDEQAAVDELGIELRLVDAVTHSSSALLARFTEEQGGRETLQAHAT